MQFGQNGFPRFGMVPKASSSEFVLGAMTWRSWELVVEFVKLCTFAADNVSHVPICRRIIEQQVVDRNVEGVQTDIENKTHTQVQGVEKKPSGDDELLVRNPILSLTPLQGLFSQFTCYFVLSVILGYLEWRRRSRMSPELVSF